MTALALAPPRLVRRWQRQAVGSLVWMLDRSGYLTHRLRRSPGLRILTYHGVCRDETTREPWLPPHFVTASSFARQMRILLSLGRVVSLSEVADHLAAGLPLDDPCFAITFDDGYACALRHAVPTMNRLGIKATFFVATGNVERGEWFMSDRLRVLGSLPPRLTADMPRLLRYYVGAPAQAKQVPQDRVRRILDEYWDSVSGALDRQTAETLRPASWTELGDVHGSGHEIAAHTVSHVILGQESGPRREVEIARSVRRVREQVSRCAGFAYPNGGPDDFNAADVEVLRREGIRYAVTTTPGRCVPPLDMYRLPRASIGLRHDDYTFTLEMSGCLDRRRRRQQLGDWAR